MRWVSPAADAVQLGSVRDSADGGCRIWGSVLCVVVGDGRETEVGLSTKLVRLNICLSVGSLGVGTGSGSDAALVPVSGEGEWA